MTEFAGTLGSVGLKKLDNQNCIRIENSLLLSYLLKDNEFLKVRVGGESEYCVYYAVLIELVEHIPNLEQKLKNLQDMGIFIRKTWPPLHKHPHFNPGPHVPSRGMPWRADDYKGQMRKVDYKDQVLKNVTNLCPHKIFEVYVHPPVDSELIKVAANQINREFSA